VQSVFVVCFGSKKRILLHKFKGSFALSTAKNLAVCLQFTRGTRILLRPIALCAMPSYPVAHVFLTLQWGSLGRASFEVHESQCDMRLGNWYSKCYCGTSVTETSTLKKKTKLHGLSPRENYTDRATAACRRSDCQLVRIEGATWSTWRIPPTVFLGFLDRSRYFSIKYLLSLYSRGWVHPVPDPLHFFLVVPGIEPGPPNL
jgi:hypothetical protein